jgi:acyl-CoA synthetase (NDP forming)
MRGLDYLFSPRSVALIGAAHSEQKLGGVMLKNLLRFRGEVYPVNPRYQELMGLKAYPAVTGIPKPFDLAIVMRPAPEVPGLLRELAERAKCVIIVSAGFAEVGEKGLQEEVRQVVRETGLRVLGPNCMGVFNPYRNLDTFFLTHERLRRPKRGNVAVVSQSGAILGSLMGPMRSSHIGVSKVIGYGNAVDIDEADLYEYFAHDPSVNVVVSYIESVGDGRKFLTNAKRLSESKPFLLLKAGKGESGGAAAFSHTGRLAGRYEVFHSLLKQQGIREATDFEELIDGAKALSLGRRSEGSRVCIITNGGGSAVLAADECMRQGLEVAPLPGIKRERLLQRFPHFFGIHNPLDLTAQVVDSDYLTALEELKDDYDGFLIILLPTVMGITAEVTQLLGNFRAGCAKPLVAHMHADVFSRGFIEKLERKKIPVYSSPERAVRALRTLLERKGSGHIS